MNPDTSQVRPAPGAVPSPGSVPAIPSPAFGSPAFGSFGSEQLRNDQGTLGWRFVPRVVLPVNSIAIDAIIPALQSIGIDCHQRTAPDGSPAGFAERCPEIARDEKVWHLYRFAGCVQSDAGPRELLLMLPADDSPEGLALASSALDALLYLDHPLPHLLTPLVVLYRDAGSGPVGLVPCGAVLPGAPVQPLVSSLEDPLKCPAALFTAVTTLCQGIEKFNRTHSEGAFRHTSCALDNFVVASVAEVGRELQGSPEVVPTRPNGGPFLWVAALTPGTLEFHREPAAAAAAKMNTRVTHERVLEELLTVIAAQRALPYRDSFGPRLASIADRWLASPPALGHPRPATLVASVVAQGALNVVRGEADATPSSPLAPAHLAQWAQIAGPRVVTHFCSELASACRALIDEVLTFDRLSLKFSSAPLREPECVPPEASTG